MHISQGCEQTLDIAINFKSPSPPVGYFYRLISAAFSKWEVIKFPKKDGGLQLFHGYARFSLEENKNFWLHMYLKTEEIFIKGEYISRNMTCVESYGVEVLDFLQKQTQEMPRTYGERQRATLIVRCPDHNTELPLEKLVKNKSERCTWNQITHLISIKDICKYRGMTNKQTSEACTIL
ncbi:hypothetical protein CHS0354_043121 [Potamilus streckersoni]|uniref:Uncharacterized protein n=1 Tax=Potamilus streckersoni TaxID=2493646 RepID=A0AAE0SBF9_9BIVA|nr:hypothetical protein CHS0354_043121 [Potamilus streckersoni]